jgi:uncharacterized protein
MSAENVEVVRKLVAAYDRGELEAAAELLDSDFEMVQLPEHPEAGTYRGRDAARESIEAWTGSFEDFHSEYEEFIDAGDSVVVVVHEHGRGRGSGIELDHRYGMLVTLRAGRVRRLEWFDSREDALRAAGLSD